jgi:D-alanyl-D-alanine carboxypeptidase/D-alanyl-D-alanine-endopeptidase (penicillin-binding protein 4)
MQSPCRLFIFLFFLLFLSILPVSGTTPDSTRQASNLRLMGVTDSLLSAHELLRQASAGILFYDLCADSILISTHPEKLFTPASTQKILVAQAAASVPDTMVSRTILLGSGSQRRKSFRGDLILRGDADPELSSADLLKLVEALKKRGIRRISGTVYADTSSVVPLPWGKGWSWDDIPYRFLPRLSALPVNKGVALTGADSALCTLYQGTPAENPKTPEYTAALFRSLMEQQDIRIRKQHTGFVKSPPKALVLGEVTRSRNQIIIPMLKNSDNLNAEMLLLALGKEHATPAAATAAGLAQIGRMMATWGYGSSDYRLTDGSGLSFYNALRPAQLVRALREGFHNSEWLAMLQRALPVAATDGSLKNRMLGTSAAGKVYAKTGTLTGASCLAGYAERPHGPLLAVAFMIRGYAGSAAQATQLQDQLCVLMTSL